MIHIRALTHKVPCNPFINLFSSLLSPLSSLLSPLSSPFRPSSPLFAPLLSSPILSLPESQRRELTQLRAQLGEVERRMVEAEKSRATLLRELDAMRDGKSSMVKDLIQSRDESAEEAAILSRKWLYRV